jgi:hypothetical protein
MSDIELNDSLHDEEQDIFILDEELQKQYDTVNELVYLPWKIFKLKPAEFKLFVILLKFAAKDHRKRRPFPTRKTLSKIMGLSTDRIDEYKNRLRDLGLIYWTKEKGKDPNSHWHNVYVFGTKKLDEPHFHGLSGESASSLIEGGEDAAVGESLSASAPSRDSPPLWMDEVLKEEEQEKKKYRKKFSSPDEKRNELTEITKEEALQKIKDVQFFEEWLEQPTQKMYLRCSSFNSMFQRFESQFPEKMYKNGINKEIQDEIDIHYATYGDK